MTNRDLALVFYRANLHGTGWKVETGDFGSALVMLADYTKSAKRAGDIGLWSTLNDLAKMVCAHRRGKLQKAA